MKKTDTSKLGIDWKIYECKSFPASPIFQGLTAEEFEDDGFRINEISESSMLRRKKIPESHDQYHQLIQFTVLNSALVFNLTDQKPYIVDTMQDINEFTNPLFFASSGFVYMSKYHTMETNKDQSLGFKRPFNSKKSRGLYRAFAEIDFQQLIKLQGIMLKAKKV